MRKDFKKVLCEEPRYQGWCESDKKSDALNKSKGYKKRIQKATRGNYEEWTLPKQESMFGRRGRGSKSFGEHLGPLVRFLRKSVGRKWDDVFSEIRKNCPNDGAVSAHIYQHLWSYVTRNVTKKDGKIYHISDWCGGTELFDRGQDDTFYVDAQGILRRAPRVLRKKKGKKNPNVYKHKGVIYLCKNGVWYKAYFKPIGKPQRVKRTHTGYNGTIYIGTELRYHIFNDVFLENETSSNDVVRKAVDMCKDIYGEKKYCYKMQQISTKKKKKIGLKK